MAPFYQKPENALKRAEELVAVAQHGSALNILHEIILSKRARSTPIATLEPIVLKFLQLTVLLSKGKIAREGLFAYKNIAQNANIHTIELVIKKFLEYAKNSLEAAKEKASQINLVLVDDLEAAETPEFLMMSTVSTDDSKDRTDRQVVTPWLRFLWEAYRNALDTLRNNSRLEALYEIVANEAFGFCLKYDRKTEFRRLCETLRQHLSSAAKYSNQPFAIDLNDPETLQRHLDIRFAQLNAAADMELWQEGFRSVEDIWNLIEISKKTPKPYMMANYYDKLARILMKGENYLFHSASFEKNMMILQSNPNLTKQVHSRNASQFLVSVLAIPIIRNQDDEKNKLGRLTSLLHGAEIPTRDKLLEHALSKDLFSLVSPIVKQLYELLEVQFHPLSICQKVGPLITLLSENEHLSRYVKPLHQVVLTRLLQQLSQVYSSIRISAVVELASFPAPYDYDARTIEAFVSNGCKTGEFSIRINHETQSFLFEPSVFTGDGTHKPYSRLYSLPADRMRPDLLQMKKKLEAAVSVVNPLPGQNKKEEVVKAFRKAVENAKMDREAIYYRRLLIQRKMEQQEEEAQAQAVEQEAARQVRVVEEEKERARAVLEKQIQTIKDEEARKKADMLRKELEGKNVKLREDELLDTDRLIELQIQQLEKERRELDQKTKTLMKRIDHTERAYRRVEVNSLSEDYQRQKVEEEAAYHSKKGALIEAAQRKHELNILNKKRAIRMMQDYKEFRSTLEKAREKEYALLEDEAAVKIQQEKQARIKEHEQNILAEEKKEQEKKIAAKKAEQAREQNEKEAAEREAKLDEQARIQREKLMEIEAKLERPAAAAPKPGIYKPPVSKWGAPTPMSAKPSSTAAGEPSSSAEQPTAWRRTTQITSQPTTNSAFSSIKQKDRQGREASPAQTTTSRPIIGSGKWASRRGGKTS